MPVDEKKVEMFLRELARVTSKHELENLREQYPLTQEEILFLLKNSRTGEPLYRLLKKAMKNLQDRRVEY